MNRPEVRNAFNETMIAELTQAFRAADADQDVRAVVLAGRGPAFCAGADLNWMKKMSGYSLEENHADAMGLAAMLNTIYMMKKPTVARVHGPAFAGGMGLVAACDIAVAAEEAEFCLSEVKLGLTASTISPYVVAAMGERQARRYFLTAERFSAAEALRIGLVHQLVADGGTRHQRRRTAGSAARSEPGRDRGEQGTDTQRGARRHRPGHDRRYRGAHRGGAHLA